MNIPIPIDRILMFSEQVNQTTIKTLTEKILEINNSDKLLKKLYKAHNLKYKPKPIKIFIDSYGGDCYQCFGLLGVMEKSKTPIHTIVSGCAMSCGFLIAIAGHRRFAYTQSTFLYHQISNVNVGKIKELEEGMIESRRVQKMIEEHTLKYTKISKKRLQQSYKEKEDWFIPADECLKLGVIDEII